MLGWAEKDLKRLMEKRSSARRQTRQGLALSTPIFLHARGDGGEKICRYKPLICHRHPLQPSPVCCDFRPQQPRSEKWDCPHRLTRDGLTKLCEWGGAKPFPDQAHPWDPPVHSTASSTSACTELPRQQEAVYELILYCWHSTRLVFTFLKG